MKKYFLLACLVLIYTGCEKVNEPQPKKEEKRVEIEIVQPLKKEEVTKKKKIEKSKPKIYPGTYYRIMTQSIEVFSYKGRLNNDSIIDEKKLVRPFYIKGNLLKIGKVFESTIGEKYGKIAGKNLYVSMDDLTTYTKN